MNLSLTQLNTGFPWILLLVAAAFLLKKHGSFRMAAEDSLKILLGYYMVAIGASITPSTTGAISQLMKAAFGVEGGVLNSEVYGAVLLLRHGSTGFALMFLAFCANLLLARFTPLKGVFLTSHHYMYLSLFAATMLMEMAQLSAPAAVVLGAAVLSVYGWLSVALTRRVISQVTGIADVGMANSSAEAALLGKLFGRMTRGKTVEYELAGEKKSSSLLGSIPVAVVLSTFVTYVALCIFAGSRQAHVILGNDSLLEECLLRSLLYGAQVALLLYGIRMMLTSVIELLWTLANRFVPGLWKGLDVSIMISYMPRAWEEGFLLSCLGGLLATALMICLRAIYVPIMSPTSFYFTGGLAGVCGYTYGKRRGARLAGFCTGVLATVAIGCMASGMTMGTDMGVMFGETQYGIFGLILEGISRCCIGNNL